MYFLPFQSRILKHKSLSNQYTLCGTDGAPSGAIKSERKKGKSLTLGERKHLQNVEGGLRPATSVSPRRAERASHIMPSAA